VDKIIFRVSGGMGKNICATALIKQIKHKYPDSILKVQASYPDIFINLPEVEEVYPLQPIPNFYKNHQDYEILNVEPYEDLLYRQGKDHLISTWARKLGLNIPEKLHGIINLDESEIETGKNIIQQMNFNGPLVAFQYVGGTSFQNPQMAQDPTRTKQYRDLSFDLAQQLTDALAKQGIGVLQISLPTEKRLQHAFQLSDQHILNPRYIFAILNQCKTGIFIDSFAQHAWVALGKKNAVVLWGGTNPKSLGYNSNINLLNAGSCSTLHCNRPDSYVGDFQGNGSLWKCPYSGKCMNFKPEMIVTAITEQLSKKEA
jgi:hypothetical protein